MLKNGHDDTKMDTTDEPIAIVGANCQFPGINKDIEDLDAFNEMLLQEKTPIKEVPKNRWDINQYYDVDRQKEDKIVTRKGGFMDSPELFDAAFFKIPPIEAKQMDPQHRLFLEVAIRALNDANITLESLKDTNAGVYCGLSTHDYNQLNYKDNIQFNAYTYIGAAGSAAAGRLSYFLNLKGPCITVDTACSSSLSAVYLATMALRARQCDVAIVGGVHLSLCPEVWIGLSKANMLSAMGESRSFDAHADGYVRSEGCAVVVLKRLSDAKSDQDRIHALIKGVMMNQDGGGMGIAAPNVDAQIDMHRSMLEQAHLTASDISYVETHGTGTVLGDSVELEAIQAIHQGKHSKENPLIIGALKSNLGHTITASGMASLIKIIGTFKQEMIPANLHYSTPCSIDPRSIPAIIPVDAMPFPKSDNKKRYVQISNFGFTGTNVSAIIEEPPNTTINEPHEDTSAPACFAVSANSEFSLRELLKHYVHYLQTSPANLKDICATLINCRDHYKFRCAMIVENKESLIEKIESLDYEIKKTSVDTETTWVSNDAKQSYEYFLKGANIRLKQKKAAFNPVDLPLYVFDRKAYWHDKRATTSSIPDDWCFELQWKPLLIDKHHDRKLDNKWLLIGGGSIDCGLESSGLSILKEHDNYLLDELDGIIFAPDFNASLSLDIESRVERQKNILKKILHFIKELNHKAINLRLIFVTTNASATSSKEAVNLDASMLAGFCKTLSLELPQYQSILIDLDKNDDHMFAAQIIDEMRFNHGHKREHIVAYRKGSRLVSRLEKTAQPKEKAWSHFEGRYLITGGLGGLGLISAKALLSSGAKEVILASRTVDESSIKQIQLDYPDKVIRAVSLDVSNRDKVQSLLLALNKDGLLKGIIHAAGAGMNKSLLEHQEQDIDYLFSAKVQGGWYLHEFSKNYPLDFFVVYSSISSVFGSNKESVYSATNSFLDGLIAERQRYGLAGLAIQWGPWAEVGMAKKRARDDELKNALIHNEQGRTFIQRLLCSDLSHVTVISPAYLQFMLDFVPKPPPEFYKCLSLLLNKALPEPTVAFSTWLSDYSHVVTSNQFTACKSLVTKICKKLLELRETDDLDEDAGFFDVGLDSLMMAELASELKNNLKPLLHVAATIAFDYPSINKLSNHIQSELSQHFQNTQELKKSSEPMNNDIAIIGMSCSFPNAPDIEAFEHMLENGQSGIKDIPIERWDNRLYYDPNPDAPGKTYVNKLGLVDNIKLFNPQFFGISPREAPFLDPQQRLFLENCYHALESANYPVQSLRGSATGVFAGVGSSHEYYTLLEKRGFSHDELGMFSVTGKALSIIPGRVAYTFDFKGPALSIDTACSSSLVAIHYACNSLKNREIDFALAGGVNVLLRPDGLINLSKAKALSADGQCKTFDESADGYVRSEGCGVLFLKRMADALRDKDTILAVIKGSAINNDGKSAGLTVPNGKSQEDVMQKALHQAGLEGSEVSYIEAHGTGTPLGDPIEVHAINEVYAKQRAEDNPLYVGTVKTNIGHLESAAGVAGLIKVIIGLQKKRIYRNLNFNKLNPNIKLKSTQIALYNKDWHSKHALKSAGVSAFGFSGTNAHVILQEFSSNDLLQKTSPSKMNALVLSAKSPIELDNLVQQYQLFLATTALDFNNVCFTAAVCRDHYPHRLVVLAKDAHTASQLLKNGEFATSSNRTMQEPVEATLQALTIDYLRGNQVDWAMYYKTHYEALLKVALPNYPFARAEFWLDTTDKNTNSPILDEPAEEEHQDFVSYDTALEHLYEIEWGVLDSSPLNAIDLPQFWVISNNKHKAQRLLAHVNHYLVDNIIQIENPQDKNIIFLYEESLFQDLFHCCQGLFKSRPASFTLVSENAYAVHDLEQHKVNPHHTMASAFWKSFNNELELNKTYAIDLDAESTLKACLEYAFNSTTNEVQFALRDELYVPRLKKKKLLINTTQQEKVLFCDDASYLITGGTGGLAKPLIEYLMRNGAKHMIVTSRSACPLETQHLIESAEKKGVEILHYSADASNLSQMQNIIKTIEQSAYPLKGVFHLAGVVQNDLIVDLNEEKLQLVLQSKMQSALILHELTKDLPLELFVLFSSASSILGSRRQANYAAANGFLDGLAYLRQQQGLPALSINWGIFHKVGMAAPIIQSLQKRGFIPLDERCIDILHVLLRSNLAQIILCPMQWGLYFKNTPKNMEFSLLDEEGGPLPKQSFLSFLQQHTPKEQSNILSQALFDIVVDVLDLDSSEQLSIQNDLFAMGMDSLMSLELRSRIHDKLQCQDLNFPIEYFINDPRIDKISNKLAKELQRYFAQTHSQKPAKNTRAGVATLSDTQFGFWVINKFWTSYNCPWQIQLKGKLNPEYLQKAFAFTVNQNAAFWLNFHDDMPIQTLKRQGQFIINYEDMSKDYDQSALNEIFYENANEYIALTEQPLIRVYLYKLKEDLHELHIIIPHIIIDDVSYKILFEQLRNNYTTLLSGKRLIPVKELYGYLDYVRKNNSHYEKNIVDKMDFWKVYNSGFQKLDLGRTYHVPDAARQEQNLFHYPLDKQLIEQFKEWHQERNINVTTGLIAAFHLIFYKLNAQKKVPIAIVNSGREGGRYKEVIGVFIEYIRINITLNENNSFMEFFKSIENEFLKAAPFQSCSQYIKHSGLKEPLSSIGSYLVKWYHQLFLSKLFKKSEVNSAIRPYYLKRLSMARWHTAKFIIKDTLNQMLHTKLRLLKPKRLMVVFNINPRFFTKEPQDNHFADLDIIIPNHFGALDRAIGNQALWIFLSKDQYNQYRMSINGPLTAECKDMIAQHLHHMMAKIIENDDYLIKDLIDLKGRVDASTNTR